ncbi:hypothetical protein LZ30DRAFT_716681 [Colletotrichum cereale]|nr:hypothetical protein LZ30DRAFT_716681 [Colletotrichum cereale]
MSRQNLCSVYTTNGPETPYPEPDDVGKPNTGFLRPTYRSGSPSTLHLNPSTASSRYFRPPRPSGSISSADHPRRLGSSLNSPSRTVCASTPVVEKHSMQHSMSIVSPSRWSESIGEEEASATSQASPTSVNDGPLGPRWNDYSFREADLYYGTPRQPLVERASEELPRPSPLRPSFRSPSGLWAKVTGQGDAAEQGFQVSRPRPPAEVGFVVARPNRPNNLGGGPGGGAARSTS